MTLRPLYPVAQKTAQLCQVLEISPERVMRRAGLPPDYFENEGKGSTAEQFFALFEAVKDEAKRDDIALFVGKMMAHGPFVPAIFAFSCSQNIEIGLARLALFKPLLAPLRLDVKRTDHRVSLTFLSVDPAIPLPQSMVMFELVYFIECCRMFTGEHLVPLAIDLPKGMTPTEDEVAFYGIAPQTAALPAIHLSVQDATRPLISENAEMLDDVLTDLNRQLLKKSADNAVATRVRSALIEMLPSGQSSVDAACQRLAMSKRSLQRKLRSENTSYQAVLDSVRSELSLHYLKQNDMTVEEISYLLAYQDPNSFYRAFQGWTGMTPMQARSTPMH
ncbi:transcriptional regulator, AraC family [Shimia gijangensis]|uniref:Transcriptional regulator, AraC family n=1 Tax=Shimia gijangensis TaxID=1470563 RepID=A0A1M6I713_9RHOB|nr:AraC family transcriptional regulator [Shimia gijangensis]SHJ30216.1 transcriptional regulator, AraC family [Shimia gijangensis]